MRKVFLLVVILALSAHAQQHKFGALDTANIWTNTNTYTGGVVHTGTFDASGSLFARPFRLVTVATTPTICTADEDTIYVTDGVVHNKAKVCNHTGNGFDTMGAATGTSLPNLFVVDGSIFTTIQAAVTAAGASGSVYVPSGYGGVDVCNTTCNPNGIPIWDMRRTPANAPSRYRGYINMLTDCGLKGTGLSSDDDAPNAQACFTAYPSGWFLFPQTKTGGACSYWFGSTVFPKGEGARVSGASSGFKNSNTTMGGTVICSAAGVTPFWLDMTPNSTSGITIENISLKGAEGTDHLTTPTKLNIPSDLPQYKRNIATAQRTANVLTVTITAVGTEGLTQQVGSQVKISGVSDATVNGKCIIATLTGLNTFNENPTGFTCPQNGADTGALGAGGTISLPSEGTSTADAIRVCSNFNRIRNVTIDAFGRHGINADMQAGHGCTTLFSDDLVVEDSTISGNQGNGFYCQGIDCNAGTMTINPIYYNLLWGVEDQSALGNNWFGNQISNNGSLWASTTTPATKAISTIARVLTNGSSQVSVVLSVADANIKRGSCVFIAGVTDATFNTTAGQCFFVNSFTDSTHFGYEQPGAPADASSSGGTSRMAKFSEAYLSAGVDSGAVKVGTQVQTYSQPWVGNYVEGGQDCKFGTSVIAFGGANMPTCVTSNTWTPGVSFLGVSPGVGGSTTSVHGFANEKDQDNSIFFKAGKSGGTTRHSYFRWYNNNLGSDSWGLDVDPSGATGTSGSWRLSRNSPGTGPFRLSFFGATNASGITRLNSESTGAVQINLDNNSGTGGLTVCTGGASPTCPASPSISSANAHNATSLTINGSQSITGVQGSSGTKVMAATGSFISGNLTKTDSSGNLIDAGGSLAPTPTGTGFTHITAGSQDAAAALITLTSSSHVAANQGTATTVLHGNAAGQTSFGAVALATDVSGNLAVTNLNSGTSASSSTFWRGDGTWAVPISGIANYDQSGTCGGTAAASSTLGIPGFGALNTATTCTIGVNVAGERVATRAATVVALYVKAGTAGAGAGSGVVTVRKNGSSQTMTCTIGTGTACNSAANPVSLVAGDTYGVQFTTGVGETLANVSVSLGIQ